ncbi:MAG: HAMP domain-containing histidine kinase [Bacteroidales bacterium]|nr:HAMP domain-containing histidine kinase [Bacteroidales bacterium]MCM1415383.1 HAMP domain-containing histidine kinase [bacterium]MCM1423316.1 HAMP domain-containing histidine kinase [bacterium]
MYKPLFHFLQDRQFRNHFLFLLLFCFLLILAALLQNKALTASAKDMLLSHDEAVASSLLHQGVPETVIARALTTSAPTTPEGALFLQKIGIRPELETQFRPQVFTFQQQAETDTFVILVPACLLLLGASLFFFHKRESLYAHAVSVLDRYLQNDYSHRLPQTSEGAVFRLFSAIDRLATMLQAQNETEQRSKVFLRNTISDISHQLKTPLSALSMYQEIMENEPDHPDVIRTFTQKTGLALKRMEQLIGAMLKLTRLDTGNIVFEKQRCPFGSLILQAVSELTTRAENEEKMLILDGSPDDMLFCDPAWTAEAIGNLVKNALDHMTSHGTVRVIWDVSPLAARIRVTDDGEGISPEEIYHIFKRFYRGSRPADTPGIGLGLSLAKAIIEGQDGTLSVESIPNEETAFTILLPCS